MVPSLLVPTLLLLGFLPVVAIRPEHARVPSGDLCGSSPAEIATKLNEFVQKHPSVQKVLPCSSLTAAELNTMRSEMLSLQDPRLLEELSDDDGRRPALPVRLGALHSASEGALLRDALCAETAKLWAHALPASAKQAGANLTLPSIPEADAAAWRKGGVYYNKLTTCSEGHRVPTEALDAPWKGWPHWPLQAHFTVTSHGPFPNWRLGRGPIGMTNAMLLNTTLNRRYLYNPGNPMEVWYDVKKAVTKFYHSGCDLRLVDVPGYEGRPCIHLMRGQLGQGTWYLFTADAATKQADGEFCCNDTFGRHGVNSTLGTLNVNFMDALPYMGEVDFTGDHYSGRAKRYLARLKSPEAGVALEEVKSTALGLQVWYETDLDGRPLRFAELGTDDRDYSLFVNDPDHGFLTSDNFPLISSDFDHDSWRFGPDAVEAAGLDLPEICQRPNLPNCMSPPQYMTDAAAEEQRPRSEHWPGCTYSLGDGFAKFWALDMDKFYTCDLTSGVLISDGKTEALWARPRHACHEYAVLAPESGLGRDCTINMVCPDCQVDAPKEAVLARLALHTDTCQPRATPCSAV